MLDHIKGKIPKMRYKLEDQLDVSRQILKDIGRNEYRPIEIALHDYSKIASILDRSYESSHPNFRIMTEKMSHETFDIEMKHLGLVNFDQAKISNPFGNAIFESNQQKMHVLALEVMKISKDSRGLINAPIVRIEKELEKWINQFVILNCNNRN